MTRETAMSTAVTIIDPPGLSASPAFAAAVIAPAAATVYLGGQNGTDADGRITGNTREQTIQAMRNVLAVLDAAGTDADHVVKLSIYLTTDADIREGYAASREVWGERRTAITVLIVSGLARPEALVEIEAIATIA
ncbi:RidA family protein [Ornithinimicrobium panacihumi]|uniref:RidA family protein n=1 Tax=Ornithinimicrobium panacihumi TaxID=2008449 RepID=UPI003F8BD6E9